MKKLLAIFLVLALAGTAHAYILQHFYDDFDTGHVNGADIDTHANWHTMDNYWNPSDMEAYNTGGRTDPWSLQTGVASNGNRGYNIPQLTTGEYELISAIKFNGGWNGASMNLWWDPNNRVSLTLKSNVSYGTGRGYDIVSIKDGDYQEINGGAFNMIAPNDWIQAKITYDFGTGVAKAYWRNVSEDGSGTPPAWTYIADFAHVGALPGIDKVYFGASNGHANFDEVEFNEIPEPATLAMLAVGGILALLRRRR